MLGIVVALIVDLKHDSMQVVGAAVTMVQLGKGNLRVHMPCCRGGSASPVQVAAMNVDPEADQCLADETTPFDPPTKLEVHSLKNGGSTAQWQKGYCKWLENIVEDGKPKFQREVHVIGRTSHHNLVRLIDFFHEGANRLLVYELMIEGFVKDLLFKGGASCAPVLPDRLGVALDVARGLHYLHDSDKCVTSGGEAGAVSRHLTTCTSRQWRRSGF
nr:probable serine/threonine-protein kinase PBL23 [Aegilops tauschii subsp. strangulata]